MCWYLSVWLLCRNDWWQCPSARHGLWRVGQPGSRGEGDLRAHGWRHEPAGAGRHDPQPHGQHPPETQQPARAQADASISGHEYG